MAVDLAADLLSLWLSICSLNGCVRDTCLTGSL
jgi:hypothetical protein